ncbi:tetratricopeptide repeat protein [Nocardia fluminea]|uniref:tetratricopeptide repeat protein n=1 Tax=Nocardia fluminea TaxID=134984 RepID=UPI001474FAAA|nr:tetratricopeptide repeat protein [Nocardia fluminea]
MVRDTALEIRFWGTRYLIRTKSLARAILIAKQSLRYCEEALGPDHPNTLTSCNNLAAAYRAVGRLGEAITVHEQNFADRERIPGPDHSHTLQTLDDLAAAYRAVGRLGEAITLHEQNLADRLRILGPDHPDTLNSRNPSLKPSAQLGTSRRRSPCTSKIL